MLVVLIVQQRVSQSIFDCYEKLIEIAGALPADYMVFYNGPHSGASAPDHSHMQIGLAQGVPLVEKLRNNTFPDKKIDRKSVV